MKLIRKCTIPAIAAGVILTGAPAALATTSAPAAPAAGSGSWYYYSLYPSYLSCNSAGFYLEINERAIGNYKCVETEFDGYTVVWDLYYQLGQGPGS